MTDTIRRFQYQGQDELALPAERDAFTTLKAWISGIADDLSMAEKDKKKLLIAADEIFTNIVSYGYPHEGGTANVAVEFDPAARLLTMTFTDTGVAYDPLAAAAPDVSRPLAERHPGGLGIFMVRRLMDSVEYHRQDGKNVLVLQKHLSVCGTTA